ncbi:MAG: hypothetical protein K1X79_04490 [Oligoflexia bacterium]|nr:hypothetical protein [Oligoflexia bacterium]
MPKSFIVRFGWRTVDSELLTSVEANKIYRFNWKVASTFFEPGSCMFRLTIDRFTFIFDENREHARPDIRAQAEFLNTMLTRHQDFDL